MKASTLKTLKWVFWGLIVVLAFGFVLKVNLDEAEKDRNKGEDTYTAGNMPDYFTHFSLLTLDGETFTEDNFKDWRITVINGWGNTCKACVNEMPFLEELSNEYRDRGLQVIGINADYIELEEDEDDLEESRRIVEAVGVTYPTLIPDEEFNNKVYPMTGSGLPATWLVNSHGQMVEFVSGKREKDEWAAIFDEYLALY